MRQVIAFWLIILFSAMADGVMEAFDFVGFAIASVIVLAVAWALIRSEEVRQ